MQSVGVKQPRPHMVPSGRRISRHRLQGLLGLLLHDTCQEAKAIISDADGLISGKNEGAAWQPGVANALSLVHRSMLELKSLRYLDRPRCSWMRRTRRTTRASAPGLLLYCAARSSRVCGAAGVLKRVAFLSLLTLQPGSPQAFQTSQTPCLQQLQVC